jgi:DNA-binding MarR family transcriptional regulator
VLDNIPTTRLQVLKAISTTWETAGQIATKADMPTPAVKYILDELVALKLVQRLAREDKEDGQDKRADSYKIPEDTSALLEKLTPRIRGEHTVENEPDIPPIEPTFEFGEEKSITCNPNDALSSNPWCQFGRRERQGNEPAERDLKEALVCRRVNKALAEGITDPVALSSFCDLPVCLLSRFPGVSKISSERIRSQLESHRREQHFRGVIDQRMGAGA